MIPARLFLRATAISWVLFKYRLDEIPQATKLFRPVRLARLLVPWAKAPGIEEAPRGARLRMALEELGPIFVKFGQILSTRRDLLPIDVADELAKLQEHVPPFPGEQAIEIIERAHGKSLEELFAHFDPEPLASASIAQVHAARTPAGDEVVAKVVRPRIHRQIRRDVDLLKSLAGLAQRYWREGPRLRPMDVVSEFETTIFDELDLQREGANAAQLRRNFEGSRDLYIPKVYWSHTKEDVLVLERVEGLPISDIAALDRAGVNRSKLAERGVKIFYTQVFRDNFFHADMHPGNILVSAEDPEDPTYIALDFGICGTLSPEDLRYLADNFTAFFNQNYRRVAELHLESGWIPPGARIQDLEAAVRTVCEPHFARPLGEISFGELLFKLFRVAHRFNLIIQPQLVLLQKTLLNIEGMGRELDPSLDLWATAKPVLERIMRDKHGLAATGQELRERLPHWLAVAPQMPELVHSALHQAAHGQLELQWHSPELERLREDQRRGQRRLYFAVVGAGLLVSAAVLVSFGAGDGRGMTLPAVVAACGGLGALLAGWPRRR